MGRDKIVWGRERADKGRGLEGLHSSLEGQVTPGWSRSNLMAIRKQNINSTRRSKGRKKL